MFVSGASWRTYCSTRRVFVRTARQFPSTDGRLMTGTPLSGNRWAPMAATGPSPLALAGHVVAPVRSAQPADEFTRAVARPLKASLKRVNASAGTDTRASGSSRYPFGAHLTRLATGRRCGCCQERALERQGSRTGLAAETSRRFPRCAAHPRRSPRQRLSYSYARPPSAGGSATARRKACANTSTASLFVVRYSAATWPVTGRSRKCRRSGLTIC